MAHSKAMVLNSEIKTDRPTALRAAAAKELSVEKFKDWTENRGTCCGGIRMAGESAGTKISSLKSAGYPSISDLKRAKAVWFRSTTDNTMCVTLCNQTDCRRVIFPTGEQLAFMEANGCLDVTRQGGVRGT